MPARLPLTEDREALARSLFEDGVAFDMKSARDLATNPMNFPPEDPADGTL